MGTTPEEKRGEKMPVVLQEEKRRWVKQWDSPSHSNPDKTYKVSQDNLGNFGCSCPVWKFRRKECKHIQQVKHHLNIDNDYGRTLFRPIFNFLPSNQDHVTVERKVDFETKTENVIISFPLIHFTDCPYTQPDGTSKYDGYSHNQRIFNEMLEQGIPRSEIKKYFRIK